MSNTKHTPGPWTLGGITTLPGKPATTGIWGPRQNIGDQSGPWIAKEVLVQDARLIMAAPELLEALNDLLYEVVASGNGNAKDFGWPEAVAKSRAAIAKAEGFRQ
jgi:hypothetical protein